MDEYLWHKLKHHVVWSVQTHQDPAVRIFLVGGGGLEVGVKGLGVKLKPVFETRII